MFSIVKKEKSSVPRPVAETTKIISIGALRLATKEVDMSSFDFVAYCGDMKMILALSTGTTDSVIRKFEFNNIKRKNPNLNLTISSVHGIVGETHMVGSTCKVIGEVELPLSFDTGKEIEIEIVEENCYEKNVSFFVALKSPEEVGNEDSKKKNRRSYDEQDEINSEELVALNGKPKLSNISRIEVIIRESDEFKNTVNKLVEQEGGSGVGFSSWSEQFTNAFRVKICDDESDPNEETTWCDYFMHFATFVWKLLFALVPPADMYNGYLCFTVSIFFIGVVTAIINDVASHFGCTVGLKDSVTAVTFVAIGTSVPDTFASKVAAIQDSTADNSVGNVTGSNAVNVFLGIGIAWSLAAFYHKANNQAFTVNTGNLAFCVTLFCTEAVVTIAILLLRRIKVIGGELGGPRTMKHTTSFFLLFLWIIYITATTMEAYGVIKGF